MDTSELDFGEKSRIGTPEYVKEQYRAIVPRVAALHSHFTPQGTLDFIKKTERERNTRLFGLSLTDEATTPQRLVFSRKVLGLKKVLGILPEEEKRSLEDIEIQFNDASSRLSSLRQIPASEADMLLMNVLNYSGIVDINDGIERLTKGPVITRFEKDGVFDYSGEEIRTVLESSFGKDIILKGRLMEIDKANGFPVQCNDISFGNSCINNYGAVWDGGFLVLPNRASYEQVAMQLEGVSDLNDLQHIFKLRAATNNTLGFSTIKVREFAVEKPSHFNYLQDVSLSDDEKMQAYFLGIIAHEVVHAIQGYARNSELTEQYNTIATEEHAAELDHQFVSKYVDRHKKLYNSPESEVFNEDNAEAIRIYLTNADFLEKHFPRRFNYIKNNLPYIQPNAIQEFVKSHVKKG